MRRALVIAALAAALLGGLAGCGKKGALEPPPASALEAPAEGRLA